MSRHRIYHPEFDIDQEKCWEQMREGDIAGVVSIAHDYGYTSAGELKATDRNLDTFMGLPPGTLAGQDHPFGSESPQSIVPDHKAEELADALDRYVDAVSCSECVERRRDEVKWMIDFCRSGGFWYSVS